MTTQDFYKRVSLGPCLRGHFTITILFRNKEYKCTSTNTLAIDALSDYCADYNSRSSDNHYYKTYKQAFVALWEECKAKNDLS